MKTQRGNIQMGVVLILNVLRYWKFWYFELLKWEVENRHCTFEALLWIQGNIIWPCGSIGDSPDIQQCRWIWLKSDQWLWYIITTLFWKVMDFSHVGIHQHVLGTKCQSSISQDARKEQYINKSFYKMDYMHYPSNSWKSCLKLRILVIIVVRWSRNWESRSGMVWDPEVGGRYFDSIVVSCLLVCRLSSNLV